MNRRNRPHSQLLPYVIILAASRGDPDAINEVLRHYEGYIARLSTRQFNDERGNAYYFVDETIRRRLEIKLIAGILAFRAV